MFTIKAMCDRVIYLRNGAVTFDGPTEEGIKLYEEDCQLSTLPWVGPRTEEWPVVVTDVEVFGERGTATCVFDHGERMRLRMRYQTRRPLKNPNFIVAFIRSDGVACCNYSSVLDGVAMDVLEGEGVVELVTPALKLTAEMYTIHVLVREGGFDQVACGQLGGTFHVRDAILSTHFGVFHEAAWWRLHGQEQTTEPKAWVAQRLSG
jgi:lipopolysaccharide transport system ATP-binding protein